MSFLCIVQCCVGIGIDGLQVLPLFMHFDIDLLGNAIHIVHQCFHVVQVLLPLLYHVCHVVSLPLYLQLLAVKLFLLKLATGLRNRLPEPRL